MELNFLPHQQRVVSEHAELTVKVNKLSEFMSSPVFCGVSAQEKTLLKAQLAFMRGYQEILGDRIQVFIEAR